MVQDTTVTVKPYELSVVAKQMECALSACCNLVGKEIARQLPKCSDVYALQSWWIMAILQLLLWPKSVSNRPQFARGHEEHHFDSSFDYTSDYTEDLGSPQSISSSPDSRQTSRESTSPPAVLCKSMTLKVLGPTLWCVGQY